MSKDVLIAAPVARLGGSAPAPLEPPPLDELYRITHAALKDERRAKRELADFAAQVSSLCLALTKIIVDAGLASDDDAVTIPRWLHQEMLGATIETGEKSDGDLYVRIAERGRQRIQLAQ